MAVRRRRLTAAELIRCHPELGAEELIRLGASAGLAITPKLVDMVRVFWSEATGTCDDACAVPPVEPPDSHRRPSARTERKFSELAREIGFDRARELVDQVEQLLNGETDVSSREETG